MLLGRSKRSQAQVKGGDEGQKAPCAKGGFMRDFFEAVGEVQTTLRQGRKALEAMGSLHDDLLQATTRDGLNAISEKIAGASEDVLSQAARSKQQLEALKEASSAQEELRPDSAECKIRVNMQLSMVKKHQQLLSDFQRMQMDLKRILERREAQDLRMLCPEASEAQVQQMIQDGATSSQVFMTKVAGSHAMLYDELARLRDKHQDILRLEKSIKELAELFQETALLVDTQGEMLDSIEVHVQNAKEYTQKGEQELITARKAQSSTAKWQCRLTAFMLVVILIISGPLLIRN
jgi:syntaxin 1A